MDFNSIYTKKELVDGRDIYDLYRSETEEKEVDNIMEINEIVKGFDDIDQYDPHPHHNMFKEYINKVDTIITILLENGKYMEDVVDLAYTVNKMLVDTFSNLGYTAVFGYKNSKWFLEIE